MVGEPVGSLVELSIGRAGGSGHQGRPIGDGVHHHLEQIGQVELPVLIVTPPLLHADCRLSAP